MDLTLVKEYLTAWKIKIIVKLICKRSIVYKIYSERAEFSMEQTGRKIIQVLQEKGE